jgi:hypothetical protein
MASDGPAEISAGCRSRRHRYSQGKRIASASPDEPTRNNQHSTLQNGLDRWCAGVLELTGRAGIVPDAISALES